MATINGITAFEAENLESDVLYRNGEYMVYKQGFLFRLDSDAELSDIQELCRKIGGEMWVMKRRDGGDWQYLARAYSLLAFDVQTDLGDDYHIYDPSIYGEDDEANADQRTKNAYAKKADNEVVVTYLGEYYSTYRREAVDFYHDCWEYEIMIYVPQAELDADQIKELSDAIYEIVSDPDGDHHSHILIENLCAGYDSFMDSEHKPEDESLKEYVENWVECEYDIDKGGSDERLWISLYKKLC